MVERSTMSTRSLNLSRIPWRAAGVAGLLLLIALGWWDGIRQAAALDHEMRTSLFQHTADITRLINPNLARKLAFTSHDVDTPAFNIIRGELMQGKMAIPEAKRVYTVASRENRIIFGPDTIATNDLQYSPPGDAYTNPPPELSAALNGTRTITASLYTSERSTFISAFMPVLDSRSGSVIMVVGVDIKASDWQTQINAARFSPLLRALLLAALIVVVAALIRWRNRRRRDESVKFKMWIIAPAAAVLLAGGVLFIAKEVWEVKRGYQANMNLLAEQLIVSWNHKLASQTAFMKEQLNYIKRNPDIQKAWMDRNIASLTTLASPAFEDMKRESGITHFNFIEPDRTCLLRMQKPTQPSAVIDRPSLLAAERTGEDCWGIDLGRLGSLSFRFVTPWKQNGTIIGYLELGTESQRLVNDFTDDINLNTAIAVRKRHSTREQFEDGRRDAGFTGQWDDYHNFAVLAASMPNLPDEVIRRLEAGHDRTIKVDVFNAKMGKTRFACGSIHVIDFSGRDVGDIIIMRDISTDIRALWSQLFLAIGMVIAACIGILALIWSVASVAERHLGIIFTRTQENEQRYRILFDSSMDALMTLEPPDWHFTSGNPATLRMFRAANIPEFTSREPWTLSPEKQPDGRDSGDKAKEIIETALRVGSHFFSWTHRRLNGEVFPATILLTRLERNSHTFLQATVRDVSVEESMLNDLRQSEVKYRSLVETTDTGFLILDGQGKVLDANQEYIRLSGHRELKDILGRSVIEWTAEGSKQRNAEAVAECASKGSIRNFITEYIDRSGQVTPVEINATVSVEGESARIVSLCRDITQYIRTEEDLKQRAAELERFNTLMIGREIRMAEMKKEINALLKAAGRKEKYVPVE